MAPRREALRERDEKWRELYESGMTLQQISTQYSMSIHAVKHGVERVGGKMRPTGYAPQYKHAHNPRQGLLRWLNS